MPGRLPTPRSSRHARSVLAVLAAALSLAAFPAAAAAADPVATASPVLSDTSTYTAACAEPPPGKARCFALIRNGMIGQANGASSGQASPLLISGVFLEPADLQNAYGLTSAAATRGAGLTVAIVDAYHLVNAESALATYRSHYGLPACTSASGCFRQVDQLGGTSYPTTDQGWNEEEALDLDMVSAICPLCNILLVEATTANVDDLGAGVDTAVALGAVAVSNSYGATEAKLGSGSELAMDAHFNHPGVAITAATGDCGYLSYLPPCNDSSAQYPSVSPYVVAVGGTSLQTAANARGWTESAWSGAGSGCSLYEPKPYWQTDGGCSSRTVADISAVADTATGVVVYDPNGLSGAGWYPYGGTSAATPIVAAAYALAGQPAAGSYPGRLLYGRAASLWDVISGSNGSCGNYLCQAAVGYDGPTGLGTPNGTGALVPDVPPPGAPTSVVAIASDATAVVTWAAPIPNGGSAITGYTVTSSPPTTSCVMTLAMTCSFSGLTNRSSYTFSVTATSAEGTGPAGSATATPLFGATYITVTPNRLVDSRPGTRLGLSASLRIGKAAQFVVVNRSADPHLNIPANAIAVTGNLTVTNQGAKGYLALTPNDPGGTPATSTLNFPKGDNRANAVTTSLSGTGTLWVTYVGASGTTADVVFDVTGYFVANSSGSTYVSLTPNRLVDSRAGTRLGLSAPLHSGTPAWFTVTDRNPSDSTRNVPADATAVTGNLTVTNQGSKGYLALTPTRPSGTPTTSTLNFPIGDNRANAVTVPLSGGKLWVTFIGTSGKTADVVFDVTGYFTGGASGATYVALTPNRLVDSRPGTRLGLGASLRSGTAAEFTVIDRSTDPALNVPPTAVAVTGNLTVTGQGSKGYLALTPDNPGGSPGTSTLNFPVGDNRANAVTSALSPSGTLWVIFVGTSGKTADAIFDVTGYFVH